MLEQVFENPTLFRNAPYHQQSARYDKDENFYLHLASIPWRPTP
jgi:hypothetical protein